MSGSDRITALLLDLDGTLVDSEPIHRRGYLAFFEHRGWDVPDLSLFTGRRAEDVFAIEAGPWSGLDPVALKREVVSFIPDEAALAVPGARDLVLAAGESGVPVAIVTSAGPAWVQRSLVESLNLPTRCVETVVTARDVVDGKPDPACYVLACARLLADPGAALAVEDAPAGVRSAVGAGVRRVHGVGTTHASALLSAAGAVEVHEDLWPLVHLVGA